MPQPCPTRAILTCSYVLSPHSACALALRALPLDVLSLQLDLVLALFTSFDIAIVVLEELDVSSGLGFELNLTAFRALRLLRVLRLLRLVQYWKGVYRIFAALIAARGQVMNIFILLFVFMTCFSLIGMQLFGGKCGAEDGSRYHFDYFVPAMLTVSRLTSIFKHVHLCELTSACVRVHRRSSCSPGDGWIRIRLVLRRVASHSRGSTS